MNAPKTRILFVDDEPQILRLLELMLKPLLNEWDMEFARSGQEALERMRKQPFDILVSDMRMPGMTGVELLNEVMRRHPRTVRVILSGYADQETVHQSIGVTHMYLSKPVEPKVLKSILLRLRSLNGRMVNGRIRTLVSESGHLPSIPKVYFEIMNALQSPSVSSHEVGAIVGMDPGLTAKVLQLANSAYVGSASNVGNPEEAVQFLGVGMIAALALTHQLFASLDPQKYHDFEVEKLWNHSVQTGLVARNLVRLETRDANLGELAFTAGLLHDVGKLILLDRATDSYRLVRRKAKLGNTALRLVERAEYDVDHADVGGYLLGIWGLPVPLVEAVFYHHEPQRSADVAFGALTAVHVANVLAQEPAPGRSSPDLSLLDAPYLTRLNLLERAREWQAELGGK